MTILGLTTSIPVGCYNFSLIVENFGNSLSSAIQQFQTSNFQEFQQKTVKDLIIRVSFYMNHYFDNIYTKTTKLAYCFFHLLWEKACGKLLYCLPHKQKYYSNKLIINRGVSFIS